MLRLQESPDDADEIELGWQAGDRWWQSESRFNRRLSERLVTRNGGEIARDEGLLRFMWTGANLESARNRAAEDLAQEFRRLAKRGGRLHVMAHSHGGNVVRRAVELVQRDPTTLAAIGSITTFGTPFFTYRRSGGLLQAGGLVAAWAALLLVLTGSMGAGHGPLIWLLGGATAFLIFMVQGPTIASLWRLASNLVSRAGATDVAAKPAWRNYFSAKDEAIGLLASFNTDVSLMRGMAREPSGGEVVLLLAVGFGVLTVAVIYGMRVSTWLKATLALPADPHGWSAPAIGAGAIQYLTFVASLAIAAAACVLGGRAYSSLRQRALRALDALITGRLRVVAYGNDIGAAIAGVATHPWPGSEAAAIPLPAAVERAIEAHVAQNTSGLWARLREGLAPGAPFASQDLRTLVQRTLTWNELAHTVYARVDDMIDQMAADLVATGDWRWRASGSTGDRARASF